jgi:hypothetical protein
MKEKKKDLSVLHIKRRGLYEAGSIFTRTQRCLDLLVVVEFSLVPVNTICRFGYKVRRAHLRELYLYGGDHNKQINMHRYTHVHTRPVGAVSSGGAEWARATFCIGKIILCRNSVKHSIEPVDRLWGDMCGCFALFTPAEKFRLAVQPCQCPGSQQSHRRHARGAHMHRARLQPHRLVHRRPRRICCHSAVRHFFLPLQKASRSRRLRRVQ